MLPFLRRTPATWCGGLAAPWGIDSRIVIAGRMRDVCAEIDRLVALEQKQRSPDA